MPLQVYNIKEKSGPTGQKVLHTPILNGILKAIAIKTEKQFELNVSYDSYFNGRILKESIQRDTILFPLVLGRDPQGKFYPIEQKTEYVLFDSLVITYQGLKNQEIDIKIVYE